MRYLFNWSAIENPVSVSNPKTPEVVSTSQYQHKFKQKTKTTKAKYRDDFLTAEELNEGCFDNLFSLFKLNKYILKMEMMDLSRFI